MILSLSRYLTENYENNERVRRLIDTTDIFLVPSINPDGAEMESRYNTNDEDLNRAFPGWRDMGLSRNKLLEGREKEVKALIKWILDNPFVLSIR